MKRFFPVIHCVDPNKQQGVGHALANARTAYDNGADGIFLIGHGLDSHTVCDLYEKTRKQFPERWIGVNFLDLAAEEDLCSQGELERAVKKCGGLNGLWMDGLPNTRPKYISSRIEVFGGVAFKCIDPNQRGYELERSCERAKLVVDVITTSGNSTGSPPDIAKLKEIRRNIGTESRLALASGVTAENISLFLPFVTDYLVASSIIEKRENRGNHEYFIPKKVLDLASKIHRG